MARDELTQTKSATDAHTRLIGGIGMGRHDPWVLRDTRSVVKGRGAPGYVEPSMDSSAPVTASSQQNWRALWGKGVVHSPSQAPLAAGSAGLGEQELLWVASCYTANLGGISAQPLPSERL